MKLQPSTHAVTIKHNMNVIKRYVGSMHEFSLYVIFWHLSSLSVKKPYNSIIIPLF